MTPGTVLIVIFFGVSEGTVLFDTLSYAGWTVLSIVRALY